jgi:hypothetical protein
VCFQPIKYAFWISISDVCKYLVSGVVILNFHINKNAINNFEYFNSESFKFVALDVIPGVKWTEFSIECSDIKISTYKTFNELFGVSNILRREKSLNYLPIVIPLVTSS